MSCSIFGREDSYNLKYLSSVEFLCFLSEIFQRGLEDWNIELSGLCFLGC